MEMYRRIKLPSHGVFGYGDELVLDMIDFEDEKKIFGSATEEALDEVMKHCVKEEGFDPENIMPEDRKYILYQLRIHSYGDEYHISVGGKDTLVSLEDMVVKELDPASVYNEEFALPMNGDKIKLRKLNVGQTRRMMRGCRDKADKLGGSYEDLLYETALALRIETVNGEKLDQNQKIAYLKTLRGKDLRYIDHKYSKLTFGYTGNVLTEIDGVEREVPVIVTGEFWNPRFDD